MCQYVRPELRLVFPYVRPDFQLGKYVHMSAINYSFRSSALINQVTCGSNLAKLLIDWQFRFLWGVESLIYTSKRTSRPCSWSLSNKSSSILVNFISLPISLIVNSGSKIDTDGAPCTCLSVGCELSCPDLGYEASKCAAVLYVLTEVLMHLHNFSS